VRGTTIQTTITLPKMEILLIVHNIKINFIYVKINCTDWVQ